MYLMKYEEKMFDLIRLSLWNQGHATADQHTYDEMKKQAIAILPMPFFSSLDLSIELKKEWTQYAIQQVSYNTRYRYEQGRLSITVPYVILKGTSAAQYYPYPQYRTMGDIDIMTRREDFETALHQLIDDGYTVTKEENREISLVKNGIIVELHRRFASLNDVEQAKYLDDLIVENINPTHLLPDYINGLVLLEHISQHLENGLGLRQIIDWMMFVDKCLPDEKWPMFRTLARNIGLETLAINVTKMCEMSLGLPQRDWCSCADESLCIQLFDYVVSSGNFGRKRVSDEDISENVIAYARTPKLAFKLLQQQGLKNWKLTKKYRFLRPFAWIYQANRYIIKGMKRNNAASKLKTEYMEAKKRTAMFDKLGIKMKARGIAIYKNGKYIKKSM